MNKHCIAIRCLDRAEYLKQCLDSLEQNIGLETTDFYLFQDGAVNDFSKIRYAKNEDIEDCINVFRKSKLPNKHLFRQRHNVGSSIQKYTALKLLAPQYKYISLTANDHVFNKYYLKTLKVLFEQFKNDEDIGLIQTSFRWTGANVQSEEDAIKNENKVGYGFSHRGELNFWSEKWFKKIEPHAYPFYSLTEKCDYREFLYNSNIYKDIRDNIQKTYGTLHDDFILEKSVIRAGYKGIHTKALRFKIIGKKGHYSFSKDLWDRLHFEKVRLHDVGNVEKYILE